MTNSKFLSVLMIFTMLAITSCNDDGGNDDTVKTTTLTLNVDGLEDLGPDYAYEGWLIVNGQAVSAGIFSVEGSNLSQTEFELNADDVENATTYVLTIEPSPDSDPGPSDVHILAGDFNGNSSALSIGHGAALGDDFTTSSGGFILATPTDGGSMTDERSGVWFLDPSAGPGAGLDLPSLPAGWIYEGWAVIDGTPLSTGRFSDLSGADDNGQFSGSEAGPPFPGEDFLNNAPAGLSFPVDLSGMPIVVSVEPVPDNSSAPFTLKPLFHMVPSNVGDHIFIPMHNNAAATNPTGTVSR